jgi:uncharacterized repeat protein (TIGR03943 family)
MSKSAPGWRGIRGAARRYAAWDLACGALLAGIALMLVGTVVSGTLELYINGVLQPLVYVAVGVLVLQVAALTLSPRVPAAELDCAANCAVDQGVNTLSVRRWLSLCALCAPILLGLVVRPQVLGSAAIAGQDISAITPPPAVVQTASTFDMDQAYEPAGDEPDPLKRNILQWRRIISGVRDPVAAFAGQPVDLVGFVYHAPSDGTNHFSIARYVIRCCVADATPLGLPVQTTEATGLKPDTWVRVHGAFVVGTINGQTALVIEAHQIEPVPQPSTPYINGLS